MGLKIIAHIICFLAYAIMFGYTFFNTNRKLIIILQMLVSFLFCIQYLILKAYTAACCSAFGIIEFFLFSFKGKNRFFNSLIIPIICVLVYLAFGHFTYDNYLSFLPVLCNLIAVVSFWNNKPIYIKALNVPISLMWIIYNTYYEAYVGTACQSILLIIDFYFIFMYFKKYKIEENQ